MAEYDPAEFFSAERKLCNDPATLTEAKRNWYMEGFKVGYFQCLGDYVLGKTEQDVSEKPTTSNADRVRSVGVSNSSKTTLMILVPFSANAGQI